MTATRGAGGLRGGASKKFVPKNADGIRTANRKGVRREQTAPPSGDPVRIQMIAEVAYFIAKDRGFTGGSPLEDWLTAETQVDRLLRMRGH